MEHLYTFAGMPGVARKKLRGPLVSSVSGFIKALGKHRICSSSGDHGSVTVWIADDKTYRCEFNRYRRTVSGDTFTTKADVRRWLVEWLPQRLSQGDYYS